MLFHITSVSLQFPFHFMLTSLRLLRFNFVFHDEVTVISRCYDLSLRLYRDMASQRKGGRISLKGKEKDYFTSFPLRIHYKFTLTSTRYHFELNLVIFGFTSKLLQCHFGFATTYLWFNFDFNSFTLRLYFDFT